jgi:sortase A
VTLTDDTRDGLSAPSTSLPPAIDANTEMPRAPQRERPPRRHRFRRGAKFGALVVVGVVVLFVLNARVVSSVVHEQRQKHLAADWRSPSESIGIGEALAVLQAPNVGINTVIVEGLTVDNLRSGPARYERGALPGDQGTMVVFGHRTVYGAPFGRIDEMKTGDPVVIQARNGGPIVQYVVERVETDTRLEDLVLDDDQFAYLVLVTNSSRWSGDEHTVVVASAYPVTDAPTEPPLLSDVGRVEVPFGIDSLLGLAALAVAAVSWIFLRPRAPIGVRILVTAPIATLGVVRFLMLFDSVLPFAR